MRLILSAIPSELAALAEHLGATDQGDHSVGEGVILAPAGVGFFAAYAGALSWLERFEGITEILFVGTAGLYPEVSEEEQAQAEEPDAQDVKSRALRVGGYAQASEVMLVDGACEMGLAKYASFLANERIEADLDLAEELSNVDLPKASLPKAKVACLLGLTLDEELAKRIRRNRGADLENMELYAIALIAREKNLRWGALLGITNRVGPEGHEEWRKTRAELEGGTVNFFGSV